MTTSLSLQLASHLLEEQEEEQEEADQEEEELVMVLDLEAKKTRHFEAEAETRPRPLACHQRAPVADLARHLHLLMVVHQCRHKALDFRVQVRSKEAWLSMCLTQQQQVAVVSLRN